MFDDPLGDKIEEALEAQGWDAQPAPKKPRKRKPKPAPTVVRAVAGETWHSLAERYVPNEPDAHHRIAALNGHKPLRDGTKVFLR